MSETTPDQPAQDPHAPLDLAAYRTVVIVRSDEIEGHAYRRGTRHTVDAGLLKELAARGMIDADAAQPAEG